MTAPNTTAAAAPDPIAETVHDYFAAIGLSPSAPVTGAQLAGMLEYFGLVKAPDTHAPSPFVAARTGQAPDSAIVGAINTNPQQARADWFTNQAIVGKSVLAARVLLGGTANTASKEQAIYRAALLQLAKAAPDVLTAAYAGGDYWDTSDDATSSKMKAAVLDDLASQGLPAAPEPVAAAPRPAAAPIGTTAAPSSSTANEVVSALTPLFERLFAKL